MKEYTINQPTRFQWYNNQGYCGETSLIAAGLMYGQYVSQYKVRELIGGSQSQNQILLGDNAHIAAEKLHLNYISYVGAAKKTNQFLTWVKAYALNGYPVIIGIYTNECMFYSTEPSCSTAGDKQYDHIVPVLGIGSNHPLDAPKLPPSYSLPYYSDDVLIFSDNGLQGASNNPTNPPCDPNPANPYIFKYAFTPFQKTRKEANDSTGTWYSITSTEKTYALAILGIADPNKETIPVTITTNRSISSCIGAPSYINYESPEIPDKSDSKPSPMALSLTVTVTIPDKTKSYNLYRYSDLTKVPTSNFNQNYKNAMRPPSVIPTNSGSTFTITEEIMSNEVVVYRAVSTTSL